MPCDSARDHGITWAGDLCLNGDADGGKEGLGPSMWQFSREPGVQGEAGFCGP